MNLVPLLIVGIIFNGISMISSRLNRKLMKGSGCGGQGKMKFINSAHQIVDGGCAISKFHTYEEFIVPKKPKKAMNKNPCFFNDVAFYGTGAKDLTFRKAVSAEDCYTQCQNTKDCSHFTQTRGGNCLMKTITTVVPGQLLTESLGSVSGPKICKSCFDLDTDLLGTILDVISNVENADACQELCASNGNCEGFVFVADYYALSSGNIRKCYIKGPSDTRFYRGGVISGPPSC